MLYPNQLLLGKKVMHVLAKILKNLPSEPATFTWIRLKDINPLGRTVKVRTIGVPSRAMARIHERLIEFLRMDPDKYLPYATASRPGCSPRRNALVHRFSRFFYITDIHAAYPSVDCEKLAEILARFGPDVGDTKDKWLLFLKFYCFDFGHRGGLVTGAPASPDLFNLYAEELLDRPLGALCGKYGLTYTRYLDDLTFSSFSRIGEKKRAVIREIIRGAGFSINHHKSKICDLRKGPIEITGVGLEHGGRTFLPRHYLRRIRGLLHLAAKDPVTFQSKVWGMMGLFLGTASLANRTEWELYDLYLNFCGKCLEGRYR